MTSEEINAVINNLCEKLGTTASQLLPEIAKMKTAECAVTTVIITCITILTTIFVVHSFRKNVAEKWDSDAWEALFAIACVVELFVVVTFGFTVTDLAGWITSPTAKALFYVIEKLKG